MFFKRCWKQKNMRGICSIPKTDDSPIVVQLIGNLNQRKLNNILILIVKCCNTFSVYRCSKEIQCSNTYKMKLNVMNMQR